MWHWERGNASDRCDIEREVTHLIMSDIERDVTHPDNEWLWERGNASDSVTNRGNISENVWQIELTQLNKIFKFNNIWGSNATDWQHDCEYKKSTVFLFETSIYSDCLPAEICLLCVECGSEPGIQTSRHNWVDRQIRELWPTRLPSSWHFQKSCLHRHKPFPISMLRHQCNSQTWHNLQLTRHIF